MKKNNVFLYLIISLVVLYSIFLTALFFFKTDKQTADENSSISNTEDISETNVPKGMMILIEYQDMVGLTNFVNEMYKRDIHGVIYSGPDFVEEHCEEFKKLLDYNVEIMGSYTPDPLWGMSYEEQYEALKDVKERIEDCTGKPVRILSSKYQASDENTAKAADALGVPYIVARGTTETDAFVYQPEEYDVKVLSVSNIPSIRFKYGSLCDYSYWVRGGTPEDMMIELEDAMDNDKFTLLSHTRIGGIKERWLNMWLEFWDNNEIEWVSLDEMMTTDMELPFWQIPQNHNAPYTPDTQKPVLELEEEEDVENPCAIEDLPTVLDTTEESFYVGDKIVMYHNGTGSMCLEAMEFLEGIDYESEQRLNTEDTFYEDLNELKDVYGDSEGVSDSYGYFPIIFIQDRVYSGFNDEIKEDIIGLIGE